MSYLFLREYDEVEQSIQCFYFKYILMVLLFVLDELLVDEKIS